MNGVIPAWGRILGGYAPSLSIEITRECPLRCPGCYAYNDEHLSSGINLRQVSDYKGQELIDRTVAIVRELRPLHVSIVGGEPLVRFRELSEILPQLGAMGIHVQVVTSAVRPIPHEWDDIPRLKVVVSIDGLQPEHDARRAPATYERILKHIQGHCITVHCTITRQQVQREGYLDEFLRFWSAESAVKQIWISLYTPQVGELSPERLSPADREHIVTELLRLRTQYPKLDTPKGLLESYLHPPSSPDECVFAKTTHCVSADFKTQITPCQYGGTPDCANCGCVASAALAAVARHKLPGGIRVGWIFDASFKVGTQVRWLRESVS